MGKSSTKKISAEMKPVIDKKQNAKAKKSATRNEQKQALLTADQQHKKLVESKNQINVESKSKNKAVKKTETITMIDESDDSTVSSDASTLSEKKQQNQIAKTKKAQAASKTSAAKTKETKLVTTIENNLSTSSEEEVKKDKVKPVVAMADVSSSDGSSSDEDSSDESTSSTGKVHQRSKITEPSKPVEQSKKKKQIAQKKQEDNIKQQIAKKSEETSDDSDDDTSSSDDEEAEHTANTTLKTKEQNESSSDDTSSENEDSSEDEDSSDHETTIQHAKESIKATEASTTSSEDDSEEDVKEAMPFVEKPSTSTMDPNIAQIWKCEIDETSEQPKPQWVLSYEKEENLCGPFHYQLDTEVTSSGIRPMIRFLIKAPSNEASENTSFLHESRKRQRETIDQAMSNKKQFTPNQSGKFEIFVGNLTFGTTENELRDLFQESCGKIERIKLLGQGGAAFIEFQTEEAMKSALDWNQTEYNNRRLTINLASEKPDKSNRNSFQGGNQRQSTHIDNPPNSTVIVRNIPYQTNQNELKNFFTECGEVLKVNLPVFADTGKLRGFAVAHFSNPDEANEAVKLSGTQFCGRTLTIEIAHPREQNFTPRGNNRGGSSLRSSTPRGGRRNFNPRGGRQSGGAQRMSGSHQVFHDDD